MHRIHPVYVFDVDGVITDPQTSAVNQDVIDAIHELLNDGVYVAVNTGRSFEWVESNLVNHLASRRKGAFDHFITVCEKGGEAITWHFGKQSRRQSEFALQRDAYEVAKTAFERNGQELQTMFWDATKRTMASIEKLPAASLGEFHDEQRFLVQTLQQELAGYNARIDPTTIATDVESPTAGKYAGARLVYQWAQQIVPDPAGYFVSIGDSVSDYEMARYFAEQGSRSVFVYVGKPTKAIDHHDRVEFVATPQHYALGTLEFLRQDSTSSLSVL